jgi:Class III cytochrome C family
VGYSRIVLLLLLTFLAVSSEASNQIEPLKSTDERIAVRMDIQGERGLVVFDHKRHEAFINPDPSNPHKTASGIACVGCHHTVKNVTDRSQFQTCNACHKLEGDPSNPDDAEGFDLNYREIFHRSCIGCHRALSVKASNERFKNVTFTRCAECHYKGETYIAKAEEPEPVAPPLVAKAMPSHVPFTPPILDKPLGFAGRSPDQKEPVSKHFVPVPDRWRIGFPEDPRFKKGSAWNPYGQNLLKGDYPVFGQHTFLILNLESQTFFFTRRIPVPSDVSSKDPDSAEFFGRGRLIFPRQNFVVAFEMFHGDTSFKPVDWRFRIAPNFNINYLNTQENGIVNIDVREGTNRTDNKITLQEAFGEARLWSTDPYFDTTSIRAGIQPFTSDFRGLIFRDTNLGVRLFGNFSNNRYQYNVAVFDQLEKDTNSDLNRLKFRDQRIIIANLFRQDTKWKGYQTQFSYHYNNDKPGLHTDEDLVFDINGFLVRPALIGDVVPHEIKAHYLGWAGDGHIGRWNIDHALYYVIGNDEFNGIAGREVDIHAFLAALELSIDKDWQRYRASAFFSSGDDDAVDDTATGFDAIFDQPDFAGGVFSFWNSVGIRLTQTGVALVNPESLIPTLRSSKTEGQANFVNPGILLANLGYEAELTPKVRLILNANYLRFHQTSPLETVLFQPDIRKDIGYDFGGGFLWRPLLSENWIIQSGAAVFIPGGGFKDIYSSNCSGQGCGKDPETLWNVFANVRIVY